MWYPIVLTVLVGYLLGNLNGSVCMSVLQGRGDVRSKGSGNAGLTNFVRNYGLRSAVLVVLIDVGKTALACLAGGAMLAPYGLELEGRLIGAAAVSVGHDFPVLLGFRGGKGILCGITLAFLLDWRVGLILLGTFLVFYLPTGYVSLGSVMGALAFVVAFPLFHRDNVFLIVGGVILGLLAVFMHRGNLVRLFQGKEKRTILWKRGTKS